MATSPTKKTHIVTRGHIYTYYTHPPTSAALNAKPTILLIHGWPDDASVWSELITGTLLPKGYGVIAPDCLGWGGSSKPLDEKEYDFRLMSADLRELLDTEGLGKVVVWAHDWGAGLASRFYNFYPERVLALTLTNTSYFPPSDTPFTLESLIALNESVQGHAVSWYWYLFTSEEGPQILSDHIDSLWTILHGYPATWLETFSKKDGFKQSLLADRMFTTRPYATEERKSAWVKKIRATEAGFKPGLLWYRALTEGFQDEANKEATNNLVLKVPYLLLRAEGDVYCAEADHVALKEAGLLGGDAELEVVKEAGHWVMVSDPKEYGEKIVGWLERKGF